MTRRGQYEVCFKIPLHHSFPSFLVLLLIRVRYAIDEESFGRYETELILLFFGQIGDESDGMNVGSKRSVVSHIPVISIGAEVLEILFLAHVLLVLLGNWESLVDGESFGVIELHVLVERALDCSDVFDEGVARLLWVAVEFVEFVEVPHAAQVILTLETDNVDRILLGEITNWKNPTWTSSDNDYTRLG